jgi:DNA-binding GntR family transcriptional regulator
MPQTRLPGLKIGAVRETVAAALRQALLAGHFRPGEYLEELALASDLGVSRGPVREALLILAQEGLVTHTHNRGFAVIELTQKDVAEIQIVRVALERFALELARPRVSPDDLRLLADLTERLAAAFRALDYPAMAELELRFHSAISEMSQSRWLDISLKHVIVPFFTFIKIFWEQWPGTKLTESLILAQHEAYIDYLKGKDTRSAEECVRFHLSLYDLDASG